MLVLQIIYQSARQLHQLLEPETFPWNYSAAHGSHVLPWSTGHSIQKVAVWIRIN